MRYRWTPTEYNPLDPMVNDLLNIAEGLQAIATAIADLRPVLCNDEHDIPDHRQRRPGDCP